MGDWEERNIWLVYCDVAVTRARTGKVKQISLTGSVPVLLFSNWSFCKWEAFLFVYFLFFICEVFGNLRSEFTRWPWKHSKCILQTLNSHTNDEVKYCWEWQLIPKHWLKECVNHVKASIVNSSVAPLTETHHVICPCVCKCTVDSLYLTLLHWRLEPMDSSPAWLLFVSCVTFVREYPPGLLFQAGWVGKYLSILGFRISKRFIFFKVLWSIGSGEGNHRLYRN